MKILVYFVALTLLWLGAKADSKKIVWISNKGKAGMAIRCTSGVTVFNKFLKPEEKTRWKLPGKSHTGICHVDTKGKGGGGQGYLSVFVESECKNECSWRVYDDGIAKLQLGSGVWKSFPLVSDEESARRSCEDGGEFESPAPQRHMAENDFDEKSLAPAPATVKYQRLKPRNPRPHENRGHENEAPPPKNWEHIHVAPSPLPEHDEESPPPKNRELIHVAPSPLPEHDEESPPPKNREHTHGPPSPLPEHDEESPPPRNREHTNGAPSPSPGHVESPPPKSEEETNGAPSPQPDKGELPPLPQPGSTFYTCIKEDSD